MANLEATLQRGRACLSCRRRKMRCDGARPFCTQCIRGGRQDDCEYTDNQGRTRTQILEENVARLQARLQELENPDTSSPPVLLHDPYATGRREVAAPPMQVASAGIMSANPNIPAFRPGSVPAAMAWWEFEEPPTQISDLLVKEFIPRAMPLGFILNIPRFLSSLGLPTLHPLRPHAALLHVIYLWSIHLSGNPELLQHENIFLQRAVLALQDALSGGAVNDTAIAQKRLHAMQAEVLLAVYFFCMGRYLEGRYHANASVSLAISCGLHHIRPESAFTTGESTSSLHGPTVGNIGESGLFDLAPPADVIELGERINAFWAVFYIDRCWSVAVGSPSILVDDASVGTQVDTPWPLDMDDYELTNTDPTSTSRTIQFFLAGQFAQTDTAGNSFMALRIKAAALVERAFRLAAAYNPGGGPNVHAEMAALARLITQFARNLIQLDQITSMVESVDQQRVLLVVHSMAHSAMIRLFSVRAAAAPGGDLRDANVCLVHASEILRVLEFLIEQKANSGGIIDPIIGRIWMSAAQVFMHELKRARSALPSPASQSRIEALEKNVDRMTAALIGGGDCPILSFQVTQILELLQS